MLILALLLELERNRKLRIAVAAPTGKAATRIQDSIRSAKATLACSDDDQGPTARARHDHPSACWATSPTPPTSGTTPRIPLPYDVVAVDEASMVDLALMAKLFQAIPPSARVILLGRQGPAGLGGSRGRPGRHLLRGRRGWVLRASSAGISRACTGKPLPVGVKATRCAGRLRRATAGRTTASASRAPSTGLSNAINDGRDGRGLEDPSRLRQRPGV